MVKETGVREGGETLVGMEYMRIIILLIKIEIWYISDYSMLLNFNYLLLLLIQLEEKYL